MMNLRHARKLTWGLLMAIMASACTSIDCALNHSVRCQYALCDANGEKVQLTGGQLTVSTRRTSDGSDTTLLNRQENASTFALPMSMANAADTLTFTITVGDDFSQSDVVVIEKTNNPHFESVDCAPYYYHTITSVRSTHNFIDSIVVNNKNVTNDATQENLHIYLRSGN